MSFLTKHFVNNFYFEHISLYKFIRHEIRFTSAQYYTFRNNVSDRRLETFKLKSLGVRKVFTLPNIKHNWSNLSSKFTEVLNIAFGYQKPKHFGYLWYNSLEVINIKEFFTLLDMPDTFYSRFKIVELHVWMLLYHLPQSKRFDKLIRYGLIEAMWLDTENRAQITEKYNLSFKKNMKTLYQKFKNVFDEKNSPLYKWRAFQILGFTLDVLIGAVIITFLWPRLKHVSSLLWKLSLLLYDEGFYGDDMALTSALWFSFFDQNDVDPRILEVLVSYVRHQMNRLNEMNMAISETSKENEIKFPLEPLEPHVKKVFNRF